MISIDNNCARIHSNVTKEPNGRYSRRPQVPSPNPLAEPNGDFIITVDLGDSANYTVTAGTVVGGFGNRQITLGAGNNTLTLNGGTDQITAIIGNGNNTINTTGSGDNTVTLSGGNNTVSLGDGANVIVAGDGDNTITTGFGSSQITVGNGIDTITTAGGENTITVTLPATAPVTPDTINANSSNGAVGGNTLVVATAGTFNASLVNGISDLPTGEWWSQYPCFGRHQLCRPSWYTDNYGRCRR